MTTTSIVVFAIGATVLWGGLALTLGITIYNERSNK